jgi:hypothetical protein
MATLEIEPENELRFKLSEEEQTPRCTMTLTHPGGTDEALAFKVRELSVYCGTPRSASSVPSFPSADNESLLYLVIYCEPTPSVVIGLPLLGENHAAQAIPGSSQSRSDQTGR